MLTNEDRAGVAKEIGKLMTENEEQQAKAEISRLESVMATVRRETAYGTSVGHFDVDDEPEKDPTRDPAKVASGYDYKLDGLRANQEEDPHGTDAHTPGAKLDHGKIDFTLVPPEALKSIARVMEYGAKKYSRNGWKKVPDAPRRYFAAALRHMVAFMDGRDFDPDTDEHHLDHALTNLAFLVHFRAKGTDIGEWRDDAK